MKIASVFDSSPNCTFLGDQQLTPVYDHKIKGADLVILWGGSDIGTKYYNQQPMYSWGHWKPSERDKVEWAVISEAVERDIPIFGICRGLQILNCYAGGTLWQHVDNHQGSGDHMIVTTNGKKLLTNSCHHQLVIPPAESVVVATTPDVMSPVKVGNGEQGQLEPEAVYYPGIRSFGVQGHPEWMPKNSEFNIQVRDWIKEYLYV